MVVQIVRVRPSRVTRRAGVPCVAVSADAMPATIEVAARAGFKAYLTKPLDIDAFLRCIDELWVRAPARALGAYETA